MQTQQEPLACGPYAPCLSLGGVVSYPLAGDGPPSSGSPNLMDADVSKLVPLIYVGVNEERSDNALDNESVSIVSVSLLTELKEREGLRVKQIGMMAPLDSSGMEVNDPNLPLEPSGITNVEPSLNDAKTDQREMQELSTLAMQENLKRMEEWRQESSGSSAQVHIPHTDDPTFFRSSARMRFLSCFSS